MELRRKERFLLGIAKSCLWWDENADFERKVILEDWCEEIDRHYPIQYPGSDIDEFFDKKGLDEDDLTDDEYFAYEAEYDQLFEAYEKQYDIIWEDVSNLLDKLGAMEP